MASGYARAPPAAQHAHATRSMPLSGPCLSRRTPAAIVQPIVELPDDVARMIWQRKWRMEAAESIQRGVRRTIYREWGLRSLTSEGDAGSFKMPSGLCGCRTISDVEAAHILLSAPGGTGKAQLLAAWDHAVLGVPSVVVVTPNTHTHVHRHGHFVHFPAVRSASMEEVD